MPRKPIGERPMTDAERQARCRAARPLGSTSDPDTSPRSITAAVHDAGATLSPS